VADCSTKALDFEHIYLYYLSCINFTEYNYDMRIKNFMDFLKSIKAILKVKKLVKKLLIVFVAVTLKFSAISFLSYKIGIDNNSHDPYKKVHPEPNYIGHPTVTSYVDSEPMPIEVEPNYFKSDSCKANKAEIVEKDGVHPALLNSKKSLTLTQDGKTS